MLVQPPFSAKASALLPTLTSRQFWCAHWRTLFHGLCYVLIILAMVYRIDYIVEYNPIHHVFSDPQRHWEQGVDVLRKDPMTFTDPIMYQVYVAVLAKLTVKHPELIAFYTILLCCFTPWLWYRFVRELHPNKTVAVVAWTLLSWNPSWISIYGYFMQETLLLPLLGAALWSTWRCKRKQTASSFTWMIVFWTLAGLTRGIVIPMAAVAATWLWFAQPGKIKKAVYGMLVLGLILGPLTYRSYKFVHIFAPHGMGNMNLVYSKSGKRKIKMNYERQGARWYYIFQSPAAEAKPFEPLSDWQSQRRGAVTAVVDLDEGARDWNKAFAQNTISIEEYFSLTFDNLILLFFSESWPDSNRARTLGEINYQTRWLWAPLTLIVLIGCIVYRKRIAAQRMYSVLILVWLIVQGLLPISVNEGRYRMPFTGMIVVQGLLLFGQKRRPASRRVAAIPRPVQRRFPSRRGHYQGRTPVPRKRWQTRRIIDHDKNKSL